MRTEDKRENKSLSCSMKHDTRTLLFNGKKGSSNAMLKRNRHSGLSHIDKRGASHATSKKQQRTEKDTAAEKCGLKKKKKVEIEAKRGLSKVLKRSKAEEKTHKCPKLVNGNKKQKRNEKKKKTTLTDDLSHHEHTHKKRKTIKASDPS